MKVRRGLSKKSARFTALMLAVALVLSNVGAGMLWNVYAEELAETQQESKQEPIQLTTAPEDNETTESSSKEPSEENVTTAPEENESSGENEPSGETTTTEESSAEQMNEDMPTTADENETTESSPAEPSEENVTTEAPSEEQAETTTVAETTTAAPETTVPDSETGSDSDETQGQPEGEPQNSHDGEWWEEPGMDDEILPIDESEPADSKYFSCGYEGHEHDASCKWGRDCTKVQHWHVDECCRTGSFEVHIPWPDDMKVTGNTHIIGMGTFSITMDEPSSPLNGWTEVTNNQFTTFHESIWSVSGVFYDDEFVFTSYDPVPVGKYKYNLEIYYPSKYGASAAMVSFSYEENEMEIEEGNNNVFIYVGDHSGAIKEGLEGNEVIVTPPTLDQVSVSLGTPKEEVLAKLPLSLQATAQNDQIIMFVVDEWACDNFDSNTPGEYVFVAKKTRFSSNDLPENAKLSWADGKQPSITVVVIDSENAGTYDLIVKYVYRGMYLTLNMKGDPVSTWYAASTDPQKTYSLDPQEVKYGDPIVIRVPASANNEYRLGNISVTSKTGNIQNGRGLQEGEYEFSKETDTERTLVVPKAIVDQDGKDLDLTVTVTADYGNWINFFQKFAKYNDGDGNYIFFKGENNLPAHEGYAMDTMEEPITVTPDEYTGYHFAGYQIYTFVGANGIVSQDTPEERAKFGITATDDGVVTAAPVNTNYGGEYQSFVIYLYDKNDYDITVKYVDQSTNEEIGTAYTTRQKHGTEYDITEALGQEFDGYTRVDGQTFNATGVLENELTITVYYTKNPEPTDPQPTDPEPTNPEPTEPEPTNPNPPSGGGSTGGTTPSPTPGPGPGSTTEIQDNETPLGPAPIQIEDAAVPLADGALVVIDDEDVPLSGAPETGDNRPIGAAALMAVLAIGMMGVFGSLGFRKKDTE